MLGQANSIAQFQLFMRDQNNLGLMAGLKDGTLNKDEFRDLAMLQMRNNEGAGQDKAESAGAPSHMGVNQGEVDGLRNLSQRNQQFQQILEDYRKGDYHPQPLSRDGIDARQLQQIDSIYDSYKAGRSEDHGALESLRGLGDVSYQRGQLEADGKLSAGDKKQLHGQLDQNSQVVAAADNRTLPKPQPAPTFDHIR